MPFRIYHTERSLCIICLWPFGLRVILKRPLWQIKFGPVVEFWPDQYRFFWLHRVKLKEFIPLYSVMFVHLCSFRRHQFAVLGKVTISRWIGSRVMIPRWIVTWVMIQHCIVTPVHDCILKCDPIHYSIVTPSYMIARWTDPKWFKWLIQTLRFIV